MKHTQGEWYSYNNFVKSKSEENSAIICEMKYKAYTEEAEANAKLIAAAPELLDQLIRVVNAIEDGVLWRGHIEASKNLINKATL